LVERPVRRRAGREHRKVLGEVLTRRQARRVDVDPAPAAEAARERPVGHGLREPSDECECGLGDLAPTLVVRSAGIGSGSTPRKGAGLIATETAARPRPARISVKRPPNEWLVGGEFGVGMTLDDYIAAIGLPSGGAIRASLGLASSHADIERFTAFAGEFVDLGEVPDNLPPRVGC
jgi:hypothetical protein